MQLTRMILKIATIAMISVVLVGCGKTQSDTNNDLKDSISFSEAIEKVKKVEAITLFSRNNIENEIVTTPMKTVRGDKVKELVGILSKTVEIENELSSFSKYEMILFDENEDEIGKFTFGGALTLEVEEKTFFLSINDANKFNSLLDSIGIDIE